MERLCKLGYDVGVNVIANLVAAAIIYLAGAYFGLFPAYPGAVTTAWVLLVATAGTVTLVVTLLVTRRLAAIATAGGVCILGFLVLVATSDDLNLSLARPGLYLILGLIVVALPLLLWRARQAADETAAVVEKRQDSQPPLPGL